MVSTETSTLSSIRESDKVPESYHKKDGFGSNENADRDSFLAGNIQRTISESRSIQKVVSGLEEKGGALGELEQPYDLKTFHSRADPSSDYNENDPWKYPIDQQTELRIVEFVEGDKEDPKNMGYGRKWLLTLILGAICFVVALGSAIVTGDLEGPRKELGVSEEVIILSSVTTFVLGFGFGPCLFAPMSEEVGRKPVYTVTLALGLIFIIPCALAKNIATLLICRLIDGILFSAPMTLIGGSLSDIWHSSERGQAMAIFSAAPYLGPVMGPIFGGLLGDYAPTWRWIYWTFLIVAGFFYAVLTIFVPETQASTLLKRRAIKLRKETGDQRYKTIGELKVRTFSQVALDSLLRPFLLLSELIVFLITIFMAVIYGLLYMFFFAYPIVFMNDKGWSASKTGIMFIPIGVGVILATLIAPFVNKDYNRRAQVYRDRGELPPAELRLIPMMVVCWFIPIGLFCFAWSSYTRISWAGPCFSGIAAGFGFCALYNPANNYIVDSYQHYAASALAAKTLVRSIWGACVPLFTIQMYNRLGNQWASSLMGFIALACCFIPFLFYKFGARIRKFSRYAYSPESEKH